MAGRSDAKAQDTRLELTASAVPEPARAAPAPPSTAPTQVSSLLTPPEIYVSLIHSATLRYNANLPKLILLGIQAGIYVGLGVSTCAIAGGSLSLELRTKEPGLFNFLYAIFGFPMGLTLIIFTGTDLFTSSCMYAAVGVLEGVFGLYGALRMVVVPYFSNLVGALLLLGLQTGSEVFHGKKAADFIIAVAVKKCHLDWGVCMVRGIMANFLVCLAVWLAAASRDLTGKFISVFLPISAFVALAYEHCIANMLTIPMAMVLGAPITTSEFIRHNLVPATIGNFIGGAALVGLMYALIYGRAGTALFAWWDRVALQAARMVHPGRGAAAQPHLHT